MAPDSLTVETTLTLRLSQRARARLDEQAASSGQDISAVASDLIEHAVTRSSMKEILEPVHQQAAASGMAASPPKTLPPRSTFSALKPRAWCSSR